jgi:hypothetical protein
MKFPVAAPEGEAAAVIAKMQRRAARLLQQAEDLQLACDSARQLTGFPGVSLKQQLLSFNEIADDRQAQTEAALDTICRSIEQLLESGSSGCDYRQLEEAALHNKVAMHELAELVGVTRIHREDSSGQLSRLGASMEPPASPSGGVARRSSVSQLDSPKSPAGGMPRRGSLLDLCQAQGHHAGMDMSSRPPSGSLAHAVAGAPTVTASGSKKSLVGSSAAPARRASLVGLAPVVAVPGRRASVLGGAGSGDRFTGRLPWEPDCWRLYCSVSEAALTGDVKGFLYCVSADQLVQAYDMNTYQGSTLRSRLDKAMAGGSSEDRTKLCCYLGSMRPMATEHEQVHQRLLELEAFSGKKVRGSWWSSKAAGTAPWRGTMLAEAATSCAAAAPPGPLRSAAAGRMALACKARCLLASLPEWALHVLLACAL